MVWGEGEGHLDIVKNLGSHPRRNGEPLKGFSLLTCISTHTLSPTPLEFFRDTTLFWYLPINLAMSFQCQFFFLFLKCCFPLSSWVISSYCIVSATTLLQIPPKLFFSGPQLPFPICLRNKHCIILITWISIWSAWTLLWNSMGSFFLEDVTNPYHLDH